MGKIIVTTFPRSASRFSKEVITSTFGHDAFEDGYCQISLLKQPNAFTIVRKPEEAVVSWVSAIENHFEEFAGFTKDNVVEETVPFYIDWMNAVANRVGSIYVTTFESFTTNTQNELDKMAVHFDLPPVIFNPNVINVDPRNSPGGNPVVEQASEVFNHPRWQEAVDAYNNVIEALK